MGDTLHRAAPDQPYDPTIWTYQDAVDHVLDVFDITARSNRPYRMAKAAVLYAWREIPKLHDWTYLMRASSINTVAAQSTGSIAYDHTGGTNEREVVLSGATFPTWSQFGQIKIAQQWYEIERYIDTTHVTLSERSNPGADVAAATAYSLARTKYPLPVDYMSNWRVIQTTNTWDLSPSDRVALHAEGIFQFDSPTDSLSFTVSPDPRYLNQLTLELSPPPSSAKTFAYIYKRQMRPLVTVMQSTGTVSTTGTTLTGSGTAFSSQHVGSIIRFGNDGTNLPTSPIGNRFDTNQEVYSDQRTIMTVASATAATIDAALASDASGVKMVISDPVDMEQFGAYDAFLRCAEAEFARLTNKKDKDERLALFLRELDQAKYADQRQRQITDANIGAGTYYAAWGDITPRPS